MIRKYVEGKVYFRNKRTGKVVDYEPLLSRVKHMEAFIPNPEKPKAAKEPEKPNTNTDEKAAK